MITVLLGDLGSLRSLKTLVKETPGTFQVKGGGRGQSEKDLKLSCLDCVKPTARYGSPVRGCPAPSCPNLHMGMVIA